MKTYFDHRTGETLIIKRKISTTQKLNEPPRFVLEDDSTMLVSYMINEDSSHNEFIVCYFDYNYSYASYYLEDIENPNPTKYLKHFLRKTKINILI